MFEKYSNVTFHENPSSRSRVVSCGQTDGRTDMTKLIVVFRNFTHAPKNVHNTIVKGRSKSKYKRNFPTCKTCSRSSFMCFSSSEY